MTEEKCLHCGLQTRERERFCCNGCNIAYDLINKFGFNNYYQNPLVRKQNSLEAGLLKPNETIDIDIDIGEFISKDENGLNNLYLLITEIHCAACVWLIENILKKQSQVEIARINMANKRLHLAWFGEVLYGNQLVKLIASLGYKPIPFDVEILHSEEKKYNNDLLKALVIAGFAAGNIMLLSVALWSSNIVNMGIATRSLIYWVSALIALPTIIYSGRIFFYSAFRALKARRTNMDVPISIAIILVALISLFEAANSADHIYFDSAVMLIFFLLIGRYLDFSARKKIFSASSNLLMLEGSAATIIDENGQNKIIAIKKIAKDMILLVAMGEKIAADGIIISGKSSIDTSLITGESMARDVKIGDQVFAGMINLSAPLKVQITKNKDETLLSQIVNLLENLQKNKGYYLTMADKISVYYTPIVHILALSTFILWFYFLHHNWQIALLNAAAVLIITCPCALALAVPTVQILAHGLLMKRGILLKNGAALEKLDNIKTIIFDKTGTLTIGKPSLISAPSQNDFLFRLAASITSKSKHLLSRTLYDAYEAGEIIDLETTEIAGMGLITNYQNQQIKLGKKEFVLGEENENENSNSEIYIKYQDQLAIFEFSDILRSDAKIVIETLKKIGKKIILISGDKKSVVENIAKTLAIDQFHYNKTPIEKYDLLENLRKTDGEILMIGDGLNDAPALIAADVSISPSSASDISKNSADIIFQGEKLVAILQIFSIAKKAKMLMKQNFAIAFIYNLIAVPFAIGGYIVPLFAALAMSSSSILVTLNALRLKKE